jgi:hypothetical protein
MDLNKQFMTGICGALTVVVISGCGSVAGSSAERPAAGRPADGTITMSDGSYLDVALAAVDETAGAPAGAADSAAPGETAKPGDRRARHRHHPWRARRFFRGLHGEATVRTKNGFAQVNWQRGLVTAVSGDSLTVRSADGASRQWVVNQNTRIRKKREKVSLSQLAANDWVFVIGNRSGSTRTARAAVVPIRVPKNAPVPSPTAS